MENITFMDLEPLESMEVITDKLWFHCIVIILYSVIFLLGIVGAILILLVIIRNRSMHTITYLLLANLAVSDILMCILALPFTPLTLMLRDWIFGDAMCRIVSMAPNLCVLISMLTFVAIAVHRLIITVYPLQANIKLYFALPVIAAAWVIPICICLPLVIRSRVKCLETVEHCYCTEFWPSHLSRQIYVVALLVLEYVVPSVIIALCYIYISLVLENAAQNSNRDQIEIRNNRRTNNMLIVVVVIFVSCWLPITCYLLISQFAELSSSIHLPLIYLALYGTAMCSAVYKVFVYMLMDDKFRKEMKAVLRPLSCCGRRSAVTSTAAENATVDNDKVEL